MQDVHSLPVNVGVATHAMTPLLVDYVGITSNDLELLLSSARGSNAHTQPPPSTSKDIKKTMEKLNEFSSVHLNVFIAAYLSGHAQVSQEAILNIRKLSLNSSSEWIYKCQSMALRLLLSELEASDVGEKLKINYDDPSLHQKLRQAFSDYNGNIPSISFSNCHFCFVGNINLDNEEANAHDFSSNVFVRNDGNIKCGVKIGEVYTFIDNEVVSGDYLGCTKSIEQIIRRGETAAFNFSLKSPPRKQFSTFEQIIVISVDNYIKIFVTFTVLSPKQKPFGVGFPKCLTLTVKDSPLGTYFSPLMLQLLKHQFIRQQGLICKDVINLLIGKSVIHKNRNREVMREATRIKEILEEEIDFAEVLRTYRSSLPKKALENFELPHSSAQPAGYLPGSILPTTVVAVSSMSCFPNAATKLPEALTNSKPDVLMGLILIWLAEVNFNIFDSFLISTEPISYLGLLPPYLRGIILWIVDLSWGLLLHKETTGVSLRSLALTFAAVLMRKKPFIDENNTDSVFVDFVFNPVIKETLGDSVLADISFQQYAVTAFVHWITLFGSYYEKYRCI